MNIARITPIIGSLYALLRNKLGLNVATPLGAQELSVTSAPDRRLVVLGHTPIAGFARDFGEVAGEAAMLALHTLDSATLIAEPTFVAPGDSCLRTDDPGYRWFCLSGNGTALAEWERRPLAAALTALSGACATAQHEHAISAISGLTQSLSGLTQAVADRAPLDSPVLTGTPTAPTPPVGDSSTRLATTAFVSVAVGSASGGANVSPFAAAVADWDALRGVRDSTESTPADGGAVAAWDDSSGNGLRVRTGTAPTYRANGLGAGLPAVEFDGTDDRLTASCYIGSVIKAGSFELLAVFSRLSTTVNTLLLTLGAGESSAVPRIVIELDHASLVFDYNDYTSRRLTGACAGLNTTNPVLVGARFDGGLMVFSLNGADVLTRRVTPITIAPGTAATLSIGRHAPWSYGQGNCRLGRLVLWDRSLTAAARAAAASELRTQFRLG